MPTTHDIKLGFRKGLNTDIGPFQLDAQYYRDGLNAYHDITGLVKNRRGFEMLDSADPLLVKEGSDATNFFIPSMHFHQFKKTDGNVLYSIIVRYGATLRVYCNDGSTYTSSLENLDIVQPDFTFSLTEVSNEQIYYRTKFISYGNAVIMTGSKTPIYKLVWGDASGSETFSVYKMEIKEFNEDLYELTRAHTRGKDIAGWYAREIPLKTGVSSYNVDFFFSDAAPGYAVTVFKEDANGAVTKISSGSYTYTETFDTDTNTVTSDISYSGGSTGEKLRMYFGRTPIEDQNASLAREIITISDRNKDYNTDQSFAPRQCALFGGRLVFAGLDGHLDDTDDVTYPALGAQFNKIWLSEIYPAGIEREEISVVKARPERGPLDVDDNIIVPGDGGIIRIDDASRILAIESYGGSLWVAAENGLWRITGPEEYFHISQVVVKKILSQRISCREPMVLTDLGLYVACDDNIRLVRAEGNQFQVDNITENIVSNLYNKITEDAKKQMFTRYDRANRRIFFAYTENETRLGANKYNVAGANCTFLVFDEQTLAWFPKWNIGQADWFLFDTVTIPADSYFSASDPRSSEFKKVNLLMLGQKSGNFTALKFGIMEGKAYCADYYGTGWKTAFESYFETINLFNNREGTLHSKIQIARLSVFMERQEQADATSGYYEFPGAVYMWRRWDFADQDTAGPLYENVLNSAQDTWSETPRQIYFPHIYGIASFGGARPPREVVTSSQQKLRGRGRVIALKFGNDFGDTELTGTIQEQEKGWGVYGFDIDFKEYK